MDDFTKIKLINSLIDVVARFYEKKEEASSREINHLKGFCEGLAFSLIELQALSEEEVSVILKGLGKKREVENSLSQEEIYQPKEVADTLDIPTFLRKNK